MLQVLLVVVTEQVCVNVSLVTLEAILVEHRLDISDLGFKLVNVSVVGIC